MVWWIASGADDEQYKRKNSLVRDVLVVVLSLWKGWFQISLYIVVASPINIERPWSSSQILSGKGANNWPF